MPKFSIITPFYHHNGLLQCVESVLSQTFTDFEFILVHNGGVRIPKLPKDPRIKIVSGEHLPQLIGAIKNFSFMQGVGEYLVEMDSDDLLVPDALEEINKVIVANNSPDFIGSNDAQFKDGTDFEATTPFNASYGWRYRDFDYKGHKLNELIQFAPNPSTLSHINTMPPDHIKVFKREFYHSIGGHDKTLKILDDLDIMCRVYIAGAEWVHIDKCLYIYRVGNNSWEKFKQDRFALDFPVYSRHIIPMIQRWCKDRNLPLYDICSWKNPRPGFTGVDIMPFPGVIQADLNQKWPFEDNSVGCIAATDALEHLNDKHHTMSEIYRVLAPGGYLISYTPHGLSEGGISDPTHKTFWNSRTFRYYDDAKTAQYIGNDKIRFRPMWDFTTKINEDLIYVTYHAVALKGGEEEFESRGERRF